MKRAIVTAGIGTSRLFEPYLERLERTFKEFGGADYLKIWREWPPGSRTHTEVHYGFKVHAMFEAAAQGCTSILWCDSSCNAFAPLTPVWERLEAEGHLLVEDANALGKWSSDHSLATFGMSRDEAMNIRLMCGTFIGVDLTHERSRTFLERLRSYAVPEHFNGTHVSRLPGLPPHSRPGTEGASMSLDERVFGHRSDEVYASLLAADLKMKTHTCTEFIGGGGFTPEELVRLNASQGACVKSGYDLT